jgi:hypothetical protein
MNIQYQYDLTRCNTHMNFTLHTLSGKVHSNKITTYTVKPADSDSKCDCFDMDKQDACLRPSSYSLVVTV